MWRGHARWSKYRLSTAPKRVNITTDVTMVIQYITMWVLRCDIMGAMAVMC